MRHIATAIALAITAGMTPSALGAEFVVTTTAATGVGSLEAIVGKVNASCDTAPHVITFDLNQDDAGFNGSWLSLIHI